MLSSHLCNLFNSVIVSDDQYLADVNIAAFISL